MATAQDTTKADQAKRAKADAAVAAAQADEPADVDDGGGKARVLAQHQAAIDAVARQNAGDCPVVVDDDDGPGSGKFCGGKLGHDGDHAA